MVYPIDNGFGTIYLKFNFHNKYRFMMMMMVGCVFENISADSTRSITHD